MKKLMMTGLLVGAFALVGGQVYAGGACCPFSAKKANKAASAELAKCQTTFSGMDLTVEQKQKIADLEKACAAEGSTKDACSKYMGKMRNVLTDDQKKAFDAAMEKDAS